MISCLTAVISAPVSLWLRRGGFFSPPLEMEVGSRPSFSPPGSKPIGEAPNTGCGPDAEPAKCPEIYPNVPTLMPLVTLVVNEVSYLG